MNKNNQNRKSGNRKDFKQKKPVNPGSNTRVYPKCDEMVRQSCNDIAWYSRNPSLLRDAGSISYANVLGLPVPIRDTAPEEGVIPGIYGMWLTPTFGVSKDGSSNVNTVSRLIYSDIRHANSGSRNYEAPDLMTYLLAMSSAYAWHAEMARLYGIFRTYNQKNRYIGKALVESLGYEYEDIAKNLASLRYYINYFAVKLNAFATPKSMNIYDRHAWVPLHVFKDSDQDKAQLYTMSYKALYTWSGTAYDTGSALIRTKTPGFTHLQLGTKATLSDIIAFGDNIINALLTNEDIGIMSGDILKAYGNDGVRSVVAIPEDYATIPVYDEMVLSQIHNATLALSIPDYIPGSSDPNGDITQQDGVIIYDPIIDGPGTGYSYTQLLDCGFNDPTPEYNMEATRLKAYANPTFVGNPEDGIGGYKLDTCGTEIVEQAYVWFNLDGEVRIGATLNSFYTITSSGINDSNARGAILQSLFDWHPIGYIDTNLADVGVIPFGDIFNYTLISRSTLNKLHDTALWSLMEVPGMGSKV